MKKRSIHVTSKGGSPKIATGRTWVPPHSSDYRRLSTQQQMFLNVYIQTIDAAAAAIAGGYPAPYGDSGAETLRNPKIRKALEGELWRFELSTDMALYRLSQLARGGMHDFMVFDHSPDGFSFNLKEAVERGSLPLVKSVTFRDGQVVSLELHDTIPALIAICRIHGMY